MDFFDKLTNLFTNPFRQIRGLAMDEPLNQRGREMNWQIDDQERRKERAELLYLQQKMKREQLKNNQLKQQKQQLEQRLRQEIDQLKCQKEEVEELVQKERKTVELAEAEGDYLRRLLKRKENQILILKGK